MNGTENAVVGAVLGREGDQVWLQGTRCLDCGALYFPRTPGCRNPACRGAQLEPARIEGRGLLYSYTVQRYRPPPLFSMEPWSPYALGLVDMNGGVRVLGMITDLPPEEIRIGMPLRLTAGRLNDAEATHVFVPEAEPAR
jgi:uncharacterized OB-fold protein